MGEAHDVLERYLRTTVPSATRVTVPMQEHAALGGLSLSLHDETGTPVDSPRRDQPLRLEIRVTTLRNVMALDAAVYLLDAQGTRVVNENLSDVGQTITAPPGRFRIRFELPPLLAAGDYVAGVWLGTYDENIFDGELLRFTVLPLPSDRAESQHGLVRPDGRWTIEAEPISA
jgi:hypothetical protein